MWSRRELENYLCHKETLLVFAAAEGQRQHGELFIQQWCNAMEDAISEIEQAFKTLGKDPWGADIKASEELLSPLFQRFYEKFNLPNLMKKTIFYILAGFVPRAKIEPEIQQMLNDINDILSKAAQAKPRHNDD